MNFSHPFDQIELLYVYSRYEQKGKFDFNEHMNQIKLRSRKGIIVIPSLINPLVDRRSIYHHQQNPPTTTNF